MPSVRAAERIKRWSCKTNKLFLKTCLNTKHHIKTKPPAFIVKSTDTDGKTNDNRCKSDTHALNKR